MKPDFYHIEIFEKLMELEESRGKLKDFCYSQETQALSRTIKGIRQELREKKGVERESLLVQLEEYNQQYEERKKVEITAVYNKIITGRHPVLLKKVKAKTKDAFTVGDMPSFLIGKFITLEIKNQYHLKSSNRDEIVEELRVLLDNSMPKILIRADIQHFYESIPQTKLMSRIEGDDFLSVISLKYLRKFFYEYNRLIGKQELIGLPRGISFSPVLAEIYLQEFDKKIRSISGIYFYKRYVDDIVVLANPNKIAIGDCWNAIKEIAKSLYLNLHEDGEKILKIRIPKRKYHIVTFNYLGYQFRCIGGHTDLLLTEEKMARYCKTIDCVLKAYAKVASYRTKDEHGRKHTDGILQLMHRIEVLTGNGSLDSRRNFVKTGLFYSNRLLTDLSQLDILDNYLADALNDPERFAPPRNLFNYGAGRGYEQAVSQIKEKILTQYGFRKGFIERRMYRWKDYVVILKQLQNLYYKS